MFLVSILVLVCPAAAGLGMFFVSQHSLMEKKKQETLHRICVGVVIAVHMNQTEEEHRLATRNYIQLSSWFLCSFFLFHSLNFFSCFCCCCSLVVEGPASCRFCPVLLLHQNQAGCLWARPRMAANWSSSITAG